MTFWEWLNKGSRTLWMPGIVVLPYMLIVMFSIIGMPSCPTQEEKDLKASKKWARQHVLDRLEAECKEVCHGQEHRIIVTKYSIYVECVCADGTTQSLKNRGLPSYE